MTEGIEFNEIGTVDVTFDEKTYHLGRPKFRQFKYFTGLLEAQRTELVAALQQLEDDTKEAEAKYEGKENTPKAKAELKRLREGLVEVSRTPFYERTVGIIAEMFSQIGDPLPPDPEDWPAWLAADSSLPGTILNHWKTHPKASGATLS